MSDLHLALLDQLRHLLDEVLLLRPIMERMPPDLLTAKPLGKWSVQEALGHLADMDAHVFQPRVERTVSESAPVFDDVEQDALVREHGWNGLSLSEVLNALEMNRRALVATFEALPKAAWTRSARWPDGQTRTVADIAAYAVRHTHHHLREIGYFLYGAGGAGA